eukprot:scaffold13944_cov66-Cyclotella_meneghiniana.AAC.1
MMWKHVQNDMLSAMHHLKESDQTVKERISKKTSAMRFRSFYTSSKYYPWLIYNTHGTRTGNCDNQCKLHAIQYTTDDHAESESKSFVTSAPSIEHRVISKGGGSQTFVPDLEMIKDVKSLSSERNAINAAVGICFTSSAEACSSHPRLCTSLVLPSPPEDGAANS